jgi:monoamine oxidase
MTGAVYQPPTEVVIIGGGAAGLFAADRLCRSNVSFVVLEALGRSGGRIYSRSDIGTQLGLILDEGANLINSTDTLTIRLLKKFKIPYVRRLPVGMDSMHYYFAGQLHDQKTMEHLLYSSNAIALQHMANDQAAWLLSRETDYDERFINTSISEYLDVCGADPTLKMLLRAFFWSEYGQSLEALNLEVLFEYFRIDYMAGQFKLIPDVDESYTVPGGTGQIVSHLEHSVHGNIRYERQVFRIDGEGGIDGEIRVYARLPQNSEEIYITRNIMYAAPLHSLNNIWVSLPGLSPHALNEARDVTYARGTKLHLKFRQGFHEVYQYTGIVITDTGEQIWPSSLGQNGAGLLTVLTGPMKSGKAVTARRVQHILFILEVIYPGISKFYVGCEKTVAPMSYSGSLRPGEGRDLEINTGGKHWITVGEASGDDLQGYLEGAFRSAGRGAAQLIRRLRRSSREPDMNV